MNANVDPKFNQALNEIGSDFWQEVIKTTTTMNKNREPETVRMEPIWNNKNIQYKGHPLLYSNWGKAGIVYLQDLWIDNNMASYEQIEQRVGTNGALLF